MIPLDVKSPVNIAFPAFEDMQKIVDANEKLVKEL